MTQVRWFSGFWLLLLLTFAIIGATQPVRAQNASGVFLWQGGGFKLETAPLPQDQVIAFFLARGFDSDTAKMIAREGCVFRSAIGSTGLTGEGVQVSVDLSRWKVLTDGREQGLRTRGKWVQALQDRQIDPGAAIALEWALFPTTQAFGPDDYNWGLLSFSLPPGARFDLVFSWYYDGVQYQNRFSDMECSQ